MKIVTGFAGRAHITSQDQQRLNRGIVGPDMYVLGVGNEFSAELTDSTTVTISDGDGVMQGCQFRIDSGETETVVMADGESGRFRNDLIVARYTKVPETGVEDVSLAVLRGESQETDYTQVLPDYSEGDIDEGDTVDFPLYRVHFSGFTIDDVIPLFMIIPSVDALYQMEERLADLLDTHDVKLDILRRGKFWNDLTVQNTTGMGNVNRPEITGAIPANDTPYTIVWKITGLMELYHSHNSSATRMQNSLTVRRASGTTYASGGFWSNEVAYGTDSSQMVRMLRSEAIVNQAPGEGAMTIWQGYWIDRASKCAWSQMAVEPIGWF